MRQVITKVNFGTYQFRVVEDNIFDFVRKKMVPNTHEEYVRQTVLHYLVDEMGCPISHIRSEMGIELNGLQKRCDIVVFDREGKTLIVVECKAHNETLNRSVFDQIARYNKALEAKYLWVTNGKTNYFCKMEKEMKVMTVVPKYEKLVGVAKGEAVEE